MPVFKLHTRQTEAAFDQQRCVDPFGHRLHALLAALWCFLACGPVSLVELGLIPVVLGFAIRLPRHLAVDLRLVHLTAAQLAVAWIAWLGLSTSWSSNRTLGLDELMACRFALSLVLLWPVLDRRSWLIAGLAAGFFAANLAQVSHAIGTTLNVDSLRFPRSPHRNSGWWQPVVGGSMLTAALGLHLPALLTGAGRTRILGLLGSVASLAGVLATGSRGAWIASAALLLLAMLWSLTRSPKARSTPSRLRPGHLPLIFALLLLTTFAGYRTLWPSLRERAIAGFTEVQQALRRSDYSTDTGARVLMAKVALRAIQAAPIRGVGAGAYRTWGQDYLSRHQLHADALRLHNHAHNALLHAAATTGLLGAFLFAAMLLLALRGGFWLPPPPSSTPTDPPSLPAPPPASLTGYAAGPAFALLGLILVSPFDVIQINAQTSAILWILITLCYWGRPRELI